MKHEKERQLNLLLHRSKDGTRKGTHTEGTNLGALDGHGWGADPAQKEVTAVWDCSKSTHLRYQKKLPHGSYLFADMQRAAGNLLS